MLLVHSEVAPQRRAAEVRLQQRVGLAAHVGKDAGDRELGVAEDALDGDVVARPHRQRLELGRVAQHLQDSLHLGLGGEVLVAELRGAE